VYNLKTAPLELFMKILKGLLFTGTMSLLLAQAPSLQMGAVYVCPAVQAVMKVFSCAGNAPTDMCDVQTANGRGNMRGKSTRQQVMSLLPLCHVQTEAEANAAAKAAANAPAPGSRPAAGPGGFKAGDEVQILTAGGWMNAKVTQVNGNSYSVHAENGADVQKSYPAELRRIGKLTAEDHANGQWDLHDKVQVTVQGKVMEGEISGYNGNEFDVRVPGGTVHTNVQNLRMSTAPPPAVRAAGVAPKPGLASCAGKFEGRYAPNQGGGFSLTFRSGKATESGPIVGGDQEFECWTGGGKVFLYKAGEFSTNESLDINNDGTLEDPVIGELKKKGN
jgi:hypothetical protein